MSTPGDGYAAGVAPMVNTDDLIDSRELATLLGLSHPNSVSLYQRRYHTMPRPVVDLGRGRPRLWLRSSIEDWLDSRR
jgi:predicted DNA-binding transcriptional regulator AlpA